MQLSMNSEIYEESEEGEITSNMTSEGSYNGSWKTRRIWIIRKADKGISGDENSIRYGRDRNEHDVLTSNNLFNKH